MKLQGPDKYRLSTTTSPLTVAGWTVGLALMLAGAGAASAKDICLEESCKPALRGKVLDRSASDQIKPGENTEVAPPVDGGAPVFSISVDGEHVAGTPAARDFQRQTDKALEQVDIQVKFDGLEVKPVLNVATTPSRRTYRAGEPVRFYASSNYANFVERAEIWVFHEGDEKAGSPVAVIPAELNGEAGWTMPAEGDADYSYVLRVYDAEGRFDETRPVTIARTVRFTDEKAAKETGQTTPGRGEDATAIRNIQVAGGSITVYGKNIPAGYDVSVLGESVPVDADNGFVIQKIMPSGDHAVDVTVAGGKSDGLQFTRDVNIPKNDWFYVVLADLTLGRRTGTPGIEAVRPGEFDGFYKRGRLAFYLKGKIKGKYLLTAAADTREGDLGTLFKGLDRKDARSLLRRLDPDDYYPVYGDDSTAVEDAPTRGKVYVRLERGDSHVMWGNYKTSITGTEFLRQQRGLYGASAQYRSEKSTAFGERKAEVTLYAAQPGTLPQMDVFRGTGGSAYFLKHQDITTGSQTVSVEVRDPVTGVLLERRTLTEGTDYELDAIQGMIILKRPLASSVSTGGAVQDGVNGNSIVNLVVQYEYAPAAGEVDGYVYGGRAQAWLGENVRVAATGMSEKTAGADPQAFGADIQIRHSERTFVEAEIARSSGPGFGASYSADGGLTLDDTAIAGVAGLSATAWRVRAQVGLEDISDGKLKGALSAYAGQKQRGFSTLSEQISVNQTIWGAKAEVQLGENRQLAVTYDDYRDASGKVKRVGNADVAWQINEYWRTVFGVHYVGLQTPGAMIAGQNGSRVDAGMRLEYRPDDDKMFYVFGQGTLSRSGDIRRNDRFGVGSEIRLTEKIGLDSEISYGTNGVGGVAALSYDPTANDHYYAAYKLDPDRLADPSGIYSGLGADSGVLAVGLRRKVDETYSAFAENNIDIFGKRRSITQTYGVIFTPDAQWTINGAVEFGTIIDNSVDPVTLADRSDFDRKAGSLSLGYKDDEKGLTARIRGEARIERSQDHTRDRNTYLFATGMSWKQNPDWTLIGNLDAVYSDQLTSTLLDGAYVEGSIGYAYRPVLNDKLNLLAKYTYLYDLPGPDQVNASGDLLGPAQRSHIFSIDGTYDVAPWLSVGAKYGARIGQIRERNSAVWERSEVHLGIIRADLNIVKEWDALLEGRALYSRYQHTVDYGALAAIYRHVGNNMKLGVGYNFGRFSDDLRDLTFDDQGFFFNLVGKF